MEPLTQPNEKSIATNRPKIFDVTNLNVYYSDFRAIRDVSLNVAANEITAFIGPSGCGKTTMLRSFNRMNDLIPTAKITGTLLYRGADLYNKTVDPVEVRRRIGMVFQKPNPFPKSKYDNVAYGPRISGKVKKGTEMDDLVESSLRKAALWEEVKDRLKSSALGMSGGQQQRVAIARALVTNPEIILADEPTGNLDSKTSDDIMRLLKDLNMQGKTIITITHDNEVAEQASEIIRIKDGRVI